MISELLGAAPELADGRSSEGLFDQMTSAP
jgi:hypothetical protein